MRTKLPTIELTRRPTEWAETATGRTRRWRAHNSDLVVIEVRSSLGLPSYFLIARHGAAGETPTEGRCRTKAGAFLRAQKEFLRNSKNSCKEIPLSGDILM